MEYGSFEFGKEESAENVVDQAELEKLAKEKKRLLEAEETQKKEEERKKAKEAEKQPADEPKKGFFTREKKREAGEDEDRPEIHSTEEKHAMAKEYLAIRTEELRAELAGTKADSPEAAELLADLELLTTLDEKLDNPELAVEPAVEAAYQQILEQLGEAPSEPGPESPTAVGTDGLSDDTEIIHPNHESKVVNQEEDVIPTEIVDGELGRTAENSKEPNPQPARTAVHSDGPEPVMATIDSSSAVDYSATRSTQTSAPTPHNREIRAVSAQGAEKTPERSRAAGVLIAGAIGTMLSRGSAERASAPASSTEKIKTTSPESLANIPERRINPIRRTIAEKERAVRSIALSRAVESDSVPTLSTYAEATPSRPRSNVEQPPVPPEHMQPIRLNQATKPRHVSKEVIRNVEQSSTEELLRVANTIHVEGTTVRKLYETNQIDHRGLMAIVKEGLRGGDVKKAYKKARLGAEARQGRKIEMRHDDPSFIPADVRPDISEHAKKRVETITTALEAAQHTLPESRAESATTPSASTPADYSYQQVKNAMRKKRIATISISVMLATAGAATIAWFLLG